MFFFNVIIALIIVFCIVKFTSTDCIERYLPGWGSDYKTTLGLNNKESRILNFVSNHLGSFKFDRLLYVDFYKEELISLFVSTLRNLDINKIEKNKYQKIFFYCDYILRKRYVCSLYSEDKIKKIEPYLSEQEKSVMRELSNQIRKLTLEEELLLFNRDIARRDMYYTKLTSEFSNANQFYEDIKRLESLNTTVSVKHNIYHKAYRFVIEKDKTIALKLYIHYLSINTGALKHSNISKSNQKILFEKESQQLEFETIVEKFKKDNDLQEALILIDDLFTIKRKKITLNDIAIKSAKEDLATVVDLLNNYLEDEEMDKNPELEFIREHPPIININNPTNKLTPIQTEFIELFISNSYQLTQVEIDNFANNNGLFKSQLIDGFNEQFYEQLDDLLIEEEEDVCILNKDYYEQITSI